LSQCLFASNLETLIETSLKFSFSKLAQEPVVKSASLVPTAIARSVCLANELYFFHLNHQFDLHNESDLFSL
jgi:hypothetical protein